MAKYGPTYTDAAGKERYSEGQYAGGYVDDPYLEFDPRYNVIGQDGVDRTDQPVYANPWDDTPYWPSTPPGMDPQDPDAVQWSPYPPQNNTQQPDPVSTGGGGGGGTYQPPAPVNPAPVPPGGGGFTGANYGNVSAPGMGGPLNDAMRNRIMELLGTPLDLNADQLRKTPENRAYRLGAQRAEERQRAQLAEESSAQGWSDSGGFDSALAGIRQARGEGEAGFLGQLATRYMETQRQQLYQGIQFEMSQGQFEAAQELQARLANLEASMRQSELGERARQFDLGLGYDYTALGVNANNAAFNALAGGF
jgi:hypothetical protein